MIGAIRNKLQSVLLGKAATSDYRQFPDLQFQRPRDLPPFTFLTIRAMLMDPTIRLGLAMRAAPLYQAEFAFKEPDKSEAGFKWTPGVKADTPEVGKFVHRQLNRIWRTSLHKILQAQTWGWSAGEVTYKLSADKVVEFDGILHRHARDVLALRQDGEVKGVQFRGLKNGIGKVDLGFPKAYWHVYDPESESAYSLGALLGCYSPWADKWLNGGALDVRRLFAHKDAYGGMDIGYPAGTTNTSKGEVPNRDIAREMVEQAKAGQVITRPSEVDPTSGKERWPINRASIPANPIHIFDYPKQLDVEMLRGMEIPDDVLTSESGGAWQGKQVPMQAFFTNADRWLTQIVAMLVMQILEHLVMLNWGRAVGFEVTTKPLAEQAMEQMKGDGQGAVPQAGEQAIQQPGGRGAVRAPAADALQGGGARRFSLDDSNTSELLVGQGVVEASHLVEAGRRYLDNGGVMPVRLSQQNTEVDLRQELVDACNFSPGYKKIFLRMTNGNGNGVKRLAVAHAPKGGVTIGGKKFKGGEFIPGDVLEKATDEEKAAIKGEKKNGEVGDVELTVSPVVPGTSDIAFGPDGNVVEGQISSFPVTTTERGLIQKLTTQTKKALTEAISDPDITELMALGGIKNIRIEKSNQSSRGGPKKWTAALSGDALMIHPRTGSVISTSANKIRSSGGMKRVVAHESGHGVWKFTSNTTKAEFAKALGENQEIVDHVSGIVNVKANPQAFSNTGSRIVTESFAEIIAMKHYDTERFDRLPDEVKKPIAEAMHRRVEFVATHGTK